MFDPLFNVGWFINTYSLWLTVGISIVTFIKLFCVGLYHFVEDDWEDDFGVRQMIGMSIVFPLVIGAITFASLLTLPWVVSYGWFPLSIIATVIGMAYITRGVRRLQKAMKQHVNDKSAHKGDDHV